MDTSKFSRYWGFAVLVVWGGLLLALNLLRFDAYGIDEAAAKALLINWTVAGGVVNPIVTLGVPDFRALLFFPLGAYWPGSFVALKIFMALTLFAAATLLYRWSKTHQDSETALIASGLMLVAPLSIMQINAVGTGPFLLLGFAAGVWLDQRYRKTGKQLSGWYFTQLLLVTVLVTIHPAGLAYPLALAWEWRVNAIDSRQRRQLHVGISIAAVLGLLFGYLFGTPPLAWGTNPFATLGAIFTGRIPGDPDPLTWASGIFPALLLAAIFFARGKSMLQSLMPRMLLIACAAGMVAADFGWAMIALAVMLYFGTPLLIKLNNNFGGNSFVGQRGIVMVAVFILATTFMISDRGYRSSIINNTTESHDAIIRALATEVELKEENFYTSSQWPARTMLAIKRPVLPLPPKYGTPEELLAGIGKVEFIVFDPLDPGNTHLRQQISTMSQTVETLVHQPNGVIIKVRKKQEDLTPSPVL